MHTTAPSAIFTFETPRHALRADEVLRRSLIEHEEGPPPGEVEATCDVALRIPLSDLYEAIGALTTEHADWQAVYQLGEEDEVITKLG